MKLGAKQERPPITIISSISVKPCCIFFMIIPFEEVGVRVRRRLDSSTSAFRFSFRTLHARRFVVIQVKIAQPMP